MRSALIAVLLAACTDDQSPEEKLEDMIDRANEEQVQCADYNTSGTQAFPCASICLPKPMPASTIPEGCHSQFLVTFEDTQGYCSVQFAPDRVMWLPCGVQ